MGGTLDIPKNKIMSLISDDIFLLYKEAYEEEITESFAAYMYQITHLDEISSKAEKSEKLNKALFEEIKFSIDIPDIIERMPEVIKKYDNGIIMTNEANLKREALIKRHKEKFTKYSLEERREAAKRVESYFENTNGDKISEKEKLKSL